MYDMIVLMANLISHTAHSQIILFICYSYAELKVVRWFFDMIVSHTWFMNFNFGNFECLQFNAFFRFNYNDVLCALCIQLELIFSLSIFTLRFWVSLIVEAFTLCSPHSSTKPKMSTFFNRLEFLMSSYFYSLQDWIISPLSAFDVQDFRF